MWGAILIREARLRAGLTQQQLADLSGRKRSVIARWERGVIEPGLETFLEIISVCGFDLPLELVPRDDVARERLRKNALLSPERRLQRLVPRTDEFDPYAILAALERRGVAYVVIGAFARIAQGAEETADDPRSRPVNAWRQPSSAAAGARRHRGSAGAIVRGSGRRVGFAARGRVRQPARQGERRTRAGRHPRRLRRPQTRSSSRANRPTAYASPWHRTQTSPACSPSSAETKTSRGSSISAASRHSSGERPKASSADAGARKSRRAIEVDSQRDTDASF